MTSPLFTRSSPITPTDDDLLTSWRWLCGDSVRVLGWTLVGDRFLVRDEQAVEWLDVTWGELTVVAMTVEEFERIAGSTDEQRTWFRAGLVEELARGSITLRDGECFGVKLPLAVGGECITQNFEATDLLLHVSLHGQLHRQIADLPEGTRVATFAARSDDEPVDEAT